MFAALSGSNFVSGQKSVPMFTGQGGRSGSNSAQVPEVDHV